jgi:hypothetical protein
LPEPPKGVRRGLEGGLRIHYKKLLYNKIIITILWSSRTPFVVFPYPPTSTLPRRGLGDVVIRDKKQPPGLAPPQSPGGVGPAKEGKGKKRPHKIKNAEQGAGSSSFAYVVIPHMRYNHI